MKKNLAQTPYLVEQLSENQKTEDLVFRIKHNDEYDSELTDYEEEPQEKPIPKKKTLIVRKKATIVLIISAKKAQKMAKQKTIQMK